MRSSSPRPETRSIALSDRCCYSRKPLRPHKSPKNLYLARSGRRINVAATASSPLLQVHSAAVISRKLLSAFLRNRIVVPEGLI